MRSHPKKKMSTQARCGSSGGLLIYRINNCCRVPSDGVEAGLKLDTQEVVTGGSKVRFHHHNILLPDTADTVDQGVKKRAGKGHDGTDTAEAVEDITPSKSVGTKDPIKWFGVLSPPALKQSQVGIAEILYLQVDCVFKVFCSGELQDRHRAERGLRQHPERDGRGDEQGQVRQEDAAQDPGQRGHASYRKSGLELSG